ncbi:MAG TPA: hypothetical protein VGD73_12100 [Pseudonocardia sp.]|uniref:hypothetical protein n=1 Tax=Pseudonocardia sp. TaxID=60912 RepID=UPI002ED87968
MRVQFAQAITAADGPRRPHCDTRSCRRQITMVTATKPAMTTTASTISQHPLSPSSGS